ncbi:putative polyamine aminopropyl transferase [Fagus crenata]
MMSSFPAKLMAAVLAIFLLVGDFSATSALLPYGGRKSLWPVSDSRDGSMKTVPIEEGSSEGLNINSKKIVSFRSLRVSLSPPPSPFKNPQKSWVVPAPPPQFL